MAIVPYRPASRKNPLSQLIVPPSNAAVTLFFAIIAKENGGNSKFRPGRESGFDTQSPCNSNHIYLAHFRIPAMCTNNMTGMIRLFIFPAAMITILIP